MQGLNNTFASTFKHRVGNFIEFDVDRTPPRQMTQSRPSGRSVGNFFHNIIAAMDNKRDFKQRLNQALCFHIVN